MLEYDVDCAQFLSCCAQVFNTRSCSYYIDVIVQSMCQYERHTLLFLSMYCLTPVLFSKVRGLKEKKASKGELETAVKALLESKVKYKAQTGKEYEPGVKPSSGGGGSGSGSGSSAPAILTKLNEHCKKKYVAQEEQEDLKVR